MKKGIEQLDNLKEGQLVDLYEVRLILWRLASEAGRPGHHIINCYELNRQAEENRYAMVMCGGGKKMDDDPILIPNSRLETDEDRAWMKEYLWKEISRFY